MKLPTNFFRLAFLAAALLRATMFACAQQSDAATKALPPGTIASAGSAGLFVGVEQFAPNSGLRDLLYPPDDAIALARLFVIELRLLPAANVRLALAGKPRSERAQKNLRELKALGSKELGASHDDILNALDEVSSLAQDENGLLVMSFSTHGYMADGKAYVMPANGRRQSIQETAIPLSSLQNLVMQAQTRKKLLLVDACREAKDAMTKGDETMMSGFRAALSRAEGFGIISSCTDGELSREDSDFEQGVFTHFFIEACRGGVRGDPADGLIRLGNVFQYVSDKTKAWAEAKKWNQTPLFDGVESARQIPLCLDPAALEAAHKLQGRKDSAKELLHTSQKKFPKAVTPFLQAEVLNALDSTLGTNAVVLLGKMEKRLGSDDPGDIEDFADWWKQHRDEFGKGPGPTPDENAAPGPASAPAELFGSWVYFVKTQETRLVIRQNPDSSTRKTPKAAPVLVEFECSTMLSGAGTSLQVPVNISGNGSFDPGTHVLTLHPHKILAPGLPSTGWYRASGEEWRVEGNSMFHLRRLEDEVSIGKAPRTPFQNPEQVVAHRELMRQP